MTQPDDFFDTPASDHPYLRRKLSSDEFEWSEAMRGYMERHDAFEFFMQAADDGEMTRGQAIDRVRAILGMISMDQALGQDELF